MIHNAEIFVDNFAGGSGDITNLADNVFSLHRITEYLFRSKGGESYGKTSIMGTYSKAVASLGYKN